MGMRLLTSLIGSDFRRQRTSARRGTMRRVEGVDAARTGDGGDAIIEGAPVSTFTRGAGDAGRPVSLLRGLA